MARSAFYVIERDSALRMIVANKLSRQYSSETLTASDREANRTLHFSHKLVLEGPALDLLMNCEGRGLECLL